MRVYLPTTMAGLRAAVAGGRLDAPTGYAVTPALREWYVEGDLEELEYAALLEAARGSLRLLDEDPTSARRRAVVAADVPDGAVDVRPDLDRAVVRVTVPVAMSMIAAVHLDGVDAEPAVRAAADAVLEADLGSDDAKFLLDEAEGHELLWYATQEVGPLLELM